MKNYNFNFLQSLGKIYFLKLKMLRFKYGSNVFVRDTGASRNLVIRYPHVSI